MDSNYEKVTLLSKYNLMVGNVVNADGSIVPIPNATGLQDSKAVGGRYDAGEIINYPLYGSVAFSDTNYWYDASKDEMYPEFPRVQSLIDTDRVYAHYDVYNEKSNLYDINLNYNQLPLNPFQHTYTHFASMLIPWKYIPQQVPKLELHFVCLKVY